MRSPLRAVALVFLAASAAGCAASTPDAGAPTSPSTTTNPPTTVDAVDVRERFVDGAGAQGALRDLSAEDLGCVADELVAVATTEVVLSIALQGPRPHQAEMVVEALGACGVIDGVFRTGLDSGLSGDAGPPPVDPDCLLEGVTVDQMAPILVAQLARPGGVTVDGAEMEAMLADTPIMSNLLRCTLSGSGGLSPFCDGYFDVLDDVLRQVLGNEALDASADPVAYAALFDVAEDLFAWLATNVDAAHREDAVLVHDAAIVVAEAFAEVVEALDPDDPAAAETAMLAATTRLGAGLATMDAADVPAATGRLRGHLGDTCGMQSTIVFDLYGGFGAAFAAGD